METERERPPAKQRDWRHWSSLVPLIALGAFAAIWIGHTPRTPRALEIELTPPAQSELAEIPLPARVRTLEGRVLQQDGQPAADAFVWLLSGDEPHWAITGADGAFRIEGLQRGPWDVRVLAQDHAPFEIALRDEGAAHEIRIATPRRAPIALTTLARGELAGALAGAGAELYAGAEVVLAPLAPPEPGALQLPRRARADDAGRFAFPDLLAGEYALEVRPAWARGGSWPDLARPMYETDSRRVVHDPQAPAADLAVALACGSLQGSLADASERALEGGLVLVWPAGRRDRPWPSAASGADGRFAIVGLPAGRYAVSIRAAAWSWAREVEIVTGEATDLGRLVPEDGAPR